LTLRLRNMLQLTRKSIAVSAVLALALIPAAVRDLPGHQLRPVSLREQVASADCITHAKVVSYECRVEFGRIYTYYRLSSRETLKGAVSGRYLRVPGLAAGREVFELDGILSAVYRVAGDASGLPVVRLNPESVEPFLSSDGHLLPPGGVLPLEAFKKRIYKYLNNGQDEIEPTLPAGYPRSVAGQKRKAGSSKGPVLGAGNLQMVYSRAKGAPINIFWDLSRDYGPVSGGAVHWYFNPDSIAGRNDHGVTPEQAQEAAAWAFERWEEIPTASIRYKFSGNRRDISNAKLDLVNMVTFADSEFIHGNQKETIARAQPFVLRRRTYVGSEGLDYDLDGKVDFPDFPEGIWEAGTIIDCDIRWDAGGPNADLNYAVDESPWAISLQGALLHEFGHFVGLLHSPILDMGNFQVFTFGSFALTMPDPTNRTPTMFNQAFGNLLDGTGNPMNSLEYDDMVSLSMLYPSDEFKTQFGTIEGTVTRGFDGKPGKALWVVALAMPEGEPYQNLNDAYHRADIVAGVFSDQDGVFRIPGLPPGEYVLGLQTMDDIPGGTNHQAFNDWIFRFADVDFIWDEFYNGPLESDRETDPWDFEPVRVTAGAVTGGINLVTNVYHQGRMRLRRLFGNSDSSVAVNGLRVPKGSFSSTEELAARKFPQIFLHPYKVVGATCDFNALSILPLGKGIIWPQIMLTVADPDNPTLPDLENPLAVLEDFESDGSLLSTDPLPFDYPVVVDRPGELWLVVRSPERRFTAFHNIDFLNTGEGELQVDESFVSFDNGATFISLMERNISLRMGIVVEGSTGDVPLAQPRLVSSEWLSEEGTIKLHFAAVKSLSGATSPDPPVIELRHNYSAPGYPEASLLREVSLEPSSGALSFTLTRGRGRADSTVYLVTGFQSTGALKGDRLTGLVQVVEATGTASGGNLDLSRISGGGAGRFEGLWEGTFPGESEPVQMDLRAFGELVRGALIWPAEQTAEPDTSLVFSSALGDTTVLVTGLPSNPAGFSLIARDNQGRRSPDAIMGLGNDFYEPNERIKDARAIFPAYTVPSTRHGLSAIRGIILATKDEDDRDVFKFRLRQGDSVVVDVDAVSNRPFDPVSSLDAFLEAFDSTGTRFRGTDGQEVLSDDEHGLDPFLTFVSPRDATCYLKVLDASVAYGDRGDLTGFNAFYELRVTILPRKGDVIRDRVIRLDDVLAALEAAGNPDQADPQALFAADMDGNGSVDFKDAGAVFRRALEDPVAGSAALSSADQAGKQATVRISCAAESPGTWVVSAENGGSVLGAVMLTFEVSHTGIGVLPGAGLDEAAVVRSRQIGKRLFVLIEIPRTADGGGFAGGELVRLESSAQTGLRLVRAVAGIPGAGGLATLIENGSSGPAGLLPGAFSLKPNVPNPFNPTTTISYSVPESSDGSFPQVTLEVFDLRGARVRTLAKGPHRPGRYSVAWDGTDRHSRPLASGVYFYRLRAEGFTSTRKMVLLK